MTLGLEVSHYLVDAQSAAHLDRTIRDSIERCNFESILNVTSLEVSDLDGDGVSELSIAYQLGCRSDARPLTGKVLLFEGADKYALRGHTRIVDSQGNAMGGDFKIDPKTPAPFAEQMKALWSNTAKDPDSAKGETEDDEED